jgi:hypothetical protein
MLTTDVAKSDALNPRVGHLVEVLSAEEILATLDEQGKLDALPFMPEMLQYCGKRFTVDKVAHKLCDTMNRTGLRRMTNSVHLAGVRCDGQAHGGCQAGCLLYWKEAWLKPVTMSETLPEPSDDSRLLPLLVENSRRPSTDDGSAGGSPAGEVAYTCQATELLRAAPEPLPWRDLGQYVDDVRTGNVGVFWALRTFLVGLFDRFQGVTTGKLPRWMWLRGGLRWGFLRGKVEGKTPTLLTDLQPGEWVRIKSKEEIVETLNDKLLNRGLGFDAEMARFCGRTARVARRVDRIVDEKTGKLLVMQNPCIVLEGVVCEGAYNLSCPRSIPSYWREIWLERVEAPV